MDYKSLFIYEEGDLYWTARSNSLVPAGSKAGSLRKDGYVGIFINGTHYFAHRIIWEMFNGEIPEDMVIDHIDGGPKQQFNI